MHSTFVTDGSFLNFYGQRERGHADINVAEKGEPLQVSVEAIVWRERKTLDIEK